MSGEVAVPGSVTFTIELDTNENPEKDPIRELVYAYVTQAMRVVNAMTTVTYAPVKGEMDDTLSSQFVTNAPHPDGLQVRSVVLRVHASEAGAAYRLVRELSGVILAALFPDQILDLMGLDSYFSYTGSAAAMVVGLGL